jgi:phospholipid-translocating ATPase
MVRNVALPLFQLLLTNAGTAAEKPKKDIYSFVGNFTRFASDHSKNLVEPLSLDNTIWMNTVVASGTVVGVVVYTGTWYPLLLVRLVS